MAKRLLRRTWANLLSLNPRTSGQRSQRAPLTGELYARKSPVQFGGRGRDQVPVPTPIQCWVRLRPASPRCEIFGLSAAGLVRKATGAARGGSGTGRAGRLVIQIRPKPLLDFL